MTAATSTEVIHVGLYWDPELWQQARAAYVSDLDHADEAPVSFIAWLHQALALHADRTPRERAGYGIAPQRRGRGEGRGISRMSPLEPGVVEAVDAAIIEDRRQEGRLLSRSSFTHEAVTLAVRAARARIGGRELAPVAGRLPNNPPRKRDSQ